MNLLIVSLTCRTLKSEIINIKVYEKQLISRSKDTSEGFFTECFFSTLTLLTM